MTQLETYLSGKQEKHHTGYSYFLPAHINDQWKWEDQTLNLLLEKPPLSWGGTQLLCATKGSGQNNITMKTLNYEFRWSGSWQVYFDQMPNANEEVDTVQKELLK